VVSSNFDPSHLYQKLDPLASSKATPRSATHPICQRTKFSKEFQKTQREELDGHVEPTPSVVDNGYTTADFRIDDADFTPSGNSHCGKGRPLQFALDILTMKEDLPVIDTIPFRQKLSNPAQAVGGFEGLKHASDVSPKDKAGESIIDLQQEGNHDANQVAEASPSIRNKSNIELSSGMMFRTRDLFPRKTLDSVDNFEEAPDEGDECRDIGFGFGFGGTVKGGKDKPRRSSLLPTPFSPEANAIGRGYGTPRTATGQKNDHPNAAILNKHSKHSENFEGRRRVSNQPERTTADGTNEALTRHYL
jgi:hypothetical protein